MKSLLFKKEQIGKKFKNKEELKIFCKKCGTQLKGRKRYCTKCGTKVN